MAKLKHKTAKEVQQEKKEAEKRKIVEKRKKEYGSAESQLENIIEAINDGTDPVEALKNEADRIRKIKEKHPKDVE